MYTLNDLFYYSGKRVTVPNLNAPIDTYYALNSSTYIYTEFGLSDAPFRYVLPMVNVHVIQYLVHKQKLCSLLIYKKNIKYNHSYFCRY